LTARSNTASNISRVKRPVFWLYREQSALSITHLLDNLKSKTHSVVMNTQTRLSAKGQVVIPKDVRDALGLKPGMRLDVSTQGSSVTLKPVEWHNPFPRTTIEDIRAIPRWTGARQTVEQISGLSDEDVLFILDERENDARD
jgi:AbrB family looped-hinge helix DNA binding protein